LQETLLSSFHRAVAERGWMLLGMDCGPIGHGEIVERLQNMKVCGTILDTSDPELIAIVQRAGTPVVVVENWHESLEVDAVVQDGFRGGYLAASWLAERGHERIGWIGPMELNRQGSERLGGAMAALAERGIELMPDLRLSLPEPETPGRLDLVEKYLARRNRPTGVLALWQGIANLVAESRRNLGLHFGRSFEMVGWSTEDAYESEFRSNFRGGPTPPAIVWDVNMLARVAVARLAERRADPKLPPLMLKIPTRLRIDSGETT
jgi:LacI family transcriptional regulator